jgi:hypothetical protein
MVVIDWGRFAFDGRSGRNRGVAFHLGQRGERYQDAVHRSSLASSIASEYLPCFELQ